MYTAENYFWGGIVYFIGVLMFLPLVWWLTRWLPTHPLRAFFRMFMLALLLTPSFPYEDMTYMAPAWAIAGFEMVKPTQEGGVWQILKPIGFSFVVLYVLDLCIWRLFLVKKPESVEVPEPLEDDTESVL